ncbi:MAG: hypothetical protein U5M23_03135 [Marinagarivorans sp.]|nr:hypothetical protein [Marinagarivorans sp.]
MGALAPVTTIKPWHLRSMIPVLREKMALFIESEGSSGAANIMQQPLKMTGMRAFDISLSKIMQKKNYNQGNRLMPLPKGKKVISIPIYCNFRTK